MNLITIINRLVISQPRSVALVRYAAKHDSAVTGRLYVDHAEVKFGDYLAES